MNKKEGQSHRKNLVWVGTLLFILIRTIVGFLYAPSVGAGSFPSETPVPIGAPITAIETTEEPTPSPTLEPTAQPTIESPRQPTPEPTIEPIPDPTSPTVEPTGRPTPEPTTEPTEEPTASPTIEPTARPTIEPTTQPTVEPTIEPTEEPTAPPTASPTTQPTVEPPPLSCPGYATGITNEIDVIQARAALCAPDNNVAVVGSAPDSVLIVDIGAENRIIDGPSFDFYYYEAPNGPGILLDHVEVAIAEDNGMGQPGEFKAIFVWGDNNLRNNGSIPETYLPETPNKPIADADLHNETGIAIDIGADDERQYRFVRFQTHPPGATPGEGQLVQVDAIQKLIHSPTPTNTPTPEPTATPTNTPTTEPTLSPINTPTGTPSPVPTTDSASIPTSTQVTEASTPVSPTIAPTPAPSPSYTPTVIEIQQVTPVVIEDSTSVPSSTPTNLPSLEASATLTGTLAPIPTDIISPTVIVIVVTATPVPNTPTIAPTSVSLSFGPVSRPATPEINRPLWDEVGDWLEDPIIHVVLVVITLGFLIQIMTQVIGGTIVGIIVYLITEKFLKP